MKIKWIPYIITLIAIFPLVTSAQCLSSVNPVGGTNNLLVLEKNSFRFISFYKFGQSKRYYKGSNPSDFLYIKDANYNYLSAIVGYGVNSKFTMEMEAGYFLNKTYNYVHSQNPHIGKGFSNIVILGKHSIYSDHAKRFYITGAAGPKIPFSREYQYVNNIELPIEVQPTIGAYGMVLSTSFVKENSATGMRFFLTNRMEVNARNKKDYKLGTSLYNSFYVSKHLMAIKGDWTAIMQLRNKIRGTDRIAGDKKESSGSNILFLAPQINYVLKEEWYISAMVDIPVYQYFNGTQLGASTGFTVILSKTFTL